jgi:hypothetical protein
MVDAHTVYVDDSGTDSKSRIATAAFCVSTEEKWAQFERRWRNIALQEEANHSISPKNICVYHFFRNGDTSAAKKLEMDEKGILRGWIPSFAVVEQELMHNWMARVHDDLKKD